MIRYRLRELIAQKSFDEGRRVTLDEVAEHTGISRNTLSRISNNRGYNTTTDAINRLCDFFDCSVDKVIEHIKVGDESES